MTFQAHSLPATELHGVVLEMNGNNVKVIRNLRNIAKDVTLECFYFFWQSFCCPSKCKKCVYQQKDEY